MARVFDKEVQEERRNEEDVRRCTLFVDDPDVFPVDEILDIRTVNTKIEYLVKWTDYSADYNEWVAERNVTSDLKRAFSRVNKEKVMKSLKRARLRRMRRKIKLENIAKLTVKREDDSFEEKPSRSKLSLWNALKKEENEGRVIKKSPALSD